MPAGAIKSSDDWHTGTVAAACGGTTTVIDFVEPEADETLIEAFQKRRAEAEGQAVIDYGLHMTLTKADDATLAQVPDVVQAGMTSFKTYTTYEGFKLNDREFLRVMDRVRTAGGLVMVHAENDAIVRQATAALLDAGEIEPTAHPRSRPATAEVEAIHRLLALAEVTGARLYVVHISTAQGAELVAEAQRCPARHVYGETCPQYLLLTEEAYDQPGFEGAKYVCAPPLRTAVDNAVLWDALAANALQTVGTDHCPFFYESQKTLGRHDFSQIPSGLPSIEARFALLHTFGVRPGRITPNRWVELCCTAPAQIFDLAPRKGTLAPGADADIVLFDPEKRVTLSTEVLHEHVDYTPYAGLDLTGYPVATFVRGKQVMRDGKWLDREPQGHYLPAQRPPDS
jgi:dihydropyrimidinase